MWNLEVDLVIIAGLAIKLWRYCHQGWHGRLIIFGAVFHLIHVKSMLVVKAPQCELNNCQEGA